MWLHGLAARLERDCLHRPWAAGMRHRGCGCVLAVADELWLGALSAEFGAATLGQCGLGHDSWGGAVLINGFSVSGEDCLSGLWLRVDSRRRTGVGAAVEVRSRWRGRALDEMRRVGVFRRVKWAWCGRNVRPRSRGGQVDDGSGGWAFSVGPRPVSEGPVDAMMPNMLVRMGGFDRVIGGWDWVEGARGLWVG